MTGRVAAVALDLALVALSVVYICESPPAVGGGIDMEFALEAAMLLMWCVITGMDLSAWIKEAYRGG